MAKQYGLIVPNKDKMVIQRPSIFDESDSEESVPTGLKKSLKKQDKVLQSKAIEEDPTVYQYDEVYDEIDKKRKESKLSRTDLSRKPKYINRLLAAADRRKRENERRIERQVQKERETEGDEFKGKESFVTSSYKKKLEEMKEMEEQEKREEYLEAIGDVTKQGNLDGFYRHLYDQKVNYDEDKIDEKKKVKSEVLSDEDKQKLNARKYRKYEESNSEEEKEEPEATKEHIPSNLDADSDFSIDSSDSEDENAVKETVEQKEVPADEAKEQLKAEDAAPDTKEIVKLAEEPAPKKPKIDIWKKRTVGEVFDAALQRYFERKALREL